MTTPPDKQQQCGQSYRRSTPIASPARVRSAALCLVALAVAGCHTIPYTAVTIDNFEVRSPKLTVDKGFTVITTVFVDRGFDIKMTSKDSGVLNTEYKKFASAGDNKHPFDFFLQIKASIRQDPKDHKKVLIRLTPIVKQVNRMNANAFTEENLSYLTVETNAAGAKPENLNLAMRPGVGWLSLGNMLFTNVVTDISGQLGIPIEDFVQNTTKTPGQTKMIGSSD